MKQNLFWSKSRKFSIFFDLKNFHVHTISNEKIRKFSNFSQFFEFFHSKLYEKNVDRKNRKF